MQGGMSLATEEAIHIALGLNERFRMRHNVIREIMKALSFAIFNDTRLPCFFSPESRHDLRRRFTRCSEIHDGSRQ